MMMFQHPIRSRKRPRSWQCGQLSSRRVFSRSGAPLILLLVIGTLLANPQFAGAQDDSVGEYELKAAILFNLTKFVEWPDSAYSGVQAPTNLCILGRDPFGDSLASMGPKQAASGRSLLIRRLPQERDIRDCHVLYVSSSERKTLPEIFANLKGSSVLTVGEMTQFAVRGGMIQFGLQDKQVRFDINLDAASRVGLRISSRLLVLARVVHGQNAGQGEKKSAAPASSLGTIPGVNGSFGLDLEEGWEPFEINRFPGDSARLAFSDEGNDCQNGSKRR